MTLGELKELAREAMAEADAQRRRVDRMLGAEATRPTSEREQMAMLEADTAAMRRLLAIWRRHPKKVGRRPTVCLPSGRRLKVGGGHTRFVDGRRDG